MPRELPILFSGPMVLAILAGRKTVTRRTIKDADQYACLTGDCPHYRQTECDASMASFARWNAGDKLWVRETWRTGKAVDGKSPAAIAESCLDAGYREPWMPVKYGAGGQAINGEYIDRDWDGWGKTRVSIHMPRWASRITLEVLSVRAERLQEITEEEAVAEGASVLPLQDAADPSAWWQMAPGVAQARTPRMAFASLWDKINGAGAWESDPWVWRVEFRRADHV